MELWGRQTQSTHSLLLCVHEGKFTPGKYGEWRFDKRSYAQLPPPRHLGNPPPGMDNELVQILKRAVRALFCKSSALSIDGDTTGLQGALNGPSQSMRLSKVCVGQTLTCMGRTLIAGCLLMGTCHCKEAYGHGNIS